MPALQLVHVLWPMPEYVPGTHLLIVELPVQKLPVVQLKQLQLSRYWPAGQEVAHGLSGQYSLELPLLLQHVLQGPKGML